MLTTANSPKGPDQESTIMFLASVDCEAARSFDGTRWALLGLLGRGGMGEIYEAEDLHTGEHVAIKVLRKEFALRPDMADRMRIEAEALRLARHPNVVRLLASGRTPDGCSFVVLERLRGRTLREEIALRGAFPLEEAIGLGRQLLAALAAVHSAGLVHRDVKPDNVLVCDGPGRRVLKLLDFGVAKMLARARGRAGIAPLAYPTRDGACIGTPRYASPEQARGKRADPRSDLYAAGLVLYSLVAGRGPFDDLRGIDPLLDAHRQRTPEPPSRLLRGAVPPELDRIVMRALAKDPKARYPDALSFSRDLAALEVSLAKPRSTALGSASRTEAGEHTATTAPGWRRPCAAVAVAGRATERTAHRLERRFEQARARARGRAFRARSLRVLLDGQGRRARGEALQHGCEVGGRGATLVARIEIVLTAGAFAFFATGAALFFAR